MRSSETYLISAEQYEALAANGFKSEIEGVRIFSAARPRSMYNGEFVDAFAGIIRMVGDEGVSLNRAAINLGFIEDPEKADALTQERGLGINLRARFDALLSMLHL